MTRSPWQRINSNNHVYVIGDTIYDYWNEVVPTRITPDAPAPVWESLGPPVFAPGGAANVAHQFRYMTGTEVTLGTFHDSRHSLLAPRLRILSQPGGVATKTRFVANGHVLSRFDNNRGSFRSLDQDVRREIAHRVIDAVAEAVNTDRPENGVAVLSDYGQGFWGATTAQYAIERLGPRLRLVVDPKPTGAPLDAWRGVSVMKLNAAEARAFVPGTVPGNEEFAARRIHTALGCGVVVTRGAFPPIVHGIDGAGNAVTVGASGFLPGPTWASGAGDCFAAYLAAGIASGWLLGESAALAHAAGGVYVRKPYNQAVHPREARLAIGDPLAKVYTNPGELAERMGALAPDRRIGLANGVFDLFHPGHAALLRFGRERCDFLIAAVNSDESAARVKGRAPTMTAAERCAVLAAVGHVDAVIEFPEPDPVALLDRIGGCDVLVKGPDYAGSAVAGRQFARRVEIAPETVSVRSTEVRERIGGTNGS